MSDGFAAPMLAAASDGLELAEPTVAAASDGIKRASPLLATAPGGLELAAATTGVAGFGSARASDLSTVHLRSGFAPDISRLSPCMLPRTAGG